MSRPYMPFAERLSLLDFAGGAVHEEEERRLFRRRCQALELNSPNSSMRSRDQRTRTGAMRPRMGCAS
eukprot:2943044-Prymnesium_polylepis.1